MFAADKVMQNELLNVPSFKAFQEMRDASGLNGSHQVEILQSVCSKGNLGGQLTAKKRERKRILEFCALPLSAVNK